MARQAMRLTDRTLNLPPVVRETGGAVDIRGSGTAPQKPTVYVTRIRLVDNFPRTAVTYQLDPDQVEFSNLYFDFRFPLPHAGLQDLARYLGIVFTNKNNQARVFRLRTLDSGHSVVEPTSAITITLRFDPLAGDPSAIDPNSDLGVSGSIGDWVPDTEVYLDLYILSGTDAVSSSISIDAQVTRPPTGSTTGTFEATVEASVLAPGTTYVLVATSNKEHIPAALGFQTT